MWCVFWLVLVWFWVCCIVVCIFGLLVFVNFMFIYDLVSLDISV